LSWRVLIFVSSLALAAGCAGPGAGVHDQGDEGEEDGWEPTWGSDAGGGDDRLPEDARLDRPPADKKSRETKTAEVPKPAKPKKKQVRKYDYRARRSKVVEENPPPPAPEDEWDQTVTTQPPKPAPDFRVEEPPNVEPAKPKKLPPKEDSPPKGGTPESSPEKGGTSTGSAEGTPEVEPKKPPPEVVPFEKKEVSGGGDAPAEPERPPEEGGTTGEPGFLTYAGGGVILLRGGRVQPAVSVAFDANLGRFLGWRGLFAGVLLDTFVGESTFGVSYVMFDLGFGFKGRFGPEAVKFQAGLGFGLRFMALTGEAGATTGEPEVGFGLDAGGAVEVPVTGWLSAIARASARYMKDPLARQFHFSSVFSAGVGFAF